MRFHLQLVLDVTRTPRPAVDEVVERDVELGSLVERSEPHPISPRAPDVRPDPYGDDRA